MTGAMKSTNGPIFPARSLCAFLPLRSGQINRTNAGPVDIHSSAVCRIGSQHRCNLHLTNLSNLAAGRLPIGPDFGPMNRPRERIERVYRADFALYCPG